MIIFHCSDYGRFHDLSFKKALKRIRRLENSPFKSFPFKPSFYSVIKMVLNSSNLEVIILT